MRPTISLYRHPDGFHVLVTEADVDFFATLSFYDTPPLPLTDIIPTAPVVEPSGDAPAATVESASPVEAVVDAFPPVVAVDLAPPSIYVQNFVIADWVINQTNGFVTLDVRHGLQNNRSLQVKIVNKGNEPMETSWTYVSRDVIRLTVSKTPEGRFEGTITVSVGAEG